MADQYRLTSEAYNTDLKRLLDRRYGQVVIATLMAYDIINLIPQQVQYLHRRKWSKLHTIYFSVLISNWISMIINTYGDNKISASRSWCTFGHVLLIAFNNFVFAPFALKMLLVLRLRAIWNKDLIVTLILYSMTAAEVFAALCRMIVDTYVVSVSGVLLPLHGCWVKITHLDDIENNVNRVFYIVRTITTAIEVLLTFIRFIKTYRTQKAFRNGICRRISHMQTSTRLLYVFYRDGTLLFIPLLVQLILEAAIPINPSFVFETFVTYCSYFIVPFIVSRLILNLLEANCPLDESIYAGTTESFTRRRQESNRDAEADTSPEIGRETSLGEERYEEER